MFLWIRLSSGYQTVYEVLAEEELLQAILSEEQDYGSYFQWIRSASVSSMEEYKGAPAVVRAEEFSAVSPDADILIRYDKDMNANVVEWGNADGWLEWNVNVPQDGLYELIIPYAPLEGSFTEMVRGIQIDGSYPFAEAEHISFDRLWQDSTYPYERNSIQNEIRPVLSEILEWRTKPIADYSVSSEPLRWLFTEGPHKIRLVGVREPIALHSIILSPVEHPPSYVEYAANIPPGTGLEPWHSIFEAERYAYKSSSSIRTISLSEPYVSPDPEGRIVYNAIGGSYWRKPGERIAWDIEVPQDGYYAIDLKYFQGYNGNANVYRTIMIDGKVPFKEMYRYRFPPNSEMVIQPLSGADGEPYLFYLTAGVHRLEMIADNSAIRPVILALQRVNERLTEIERTVRVISGNFGYGGVVNTDEARVWEMTKYDPDIQNKLLSIRGDLEKISKYLKGLYQGVTDATTALDGAVSRVDDMLEDVNNLPNNVSVFNEIKSSLNAWTDSIETQPMHLDYLIVRTPDAKPDVKLPGAWDRAKYTAANFVRSFFLPYDSIAANDKEVLTIWVQRSRDYLDLMEQVIEQEFTPETGIRVKVHLMPNQTALLMSTAAGEQPDLALGISMEIPVDFAMRGAAQDLTVFEDFHEVADRFHPGMTRSYQYNGNMYALPENVTYNMLFIRKDIFQQLGIEPPDTWEDVLYILPTLQENGMTFFYPEVPILQTPGVAGTSFMPRQSDFITSYYQHGAEFYSSDGLRPEVASSEGYTAFRQWTEWFTKYDLPKDVPSFFNNFRYGYIPAGIADISTYIQLTVAAPELAGQWEMLPIPGIEQPDGTVERWTSTGVSSAMILEASDQKEEAWKFLKWWTSDDVQSRYARDIESFAGLEFRWHTANTNALQTLPWSDKELAVINEQWRWLKNMPIVPGYYMLPREINFAWNETLLEGTPPREALEGAQSALMREMLRKQEEFGLTPATDLRIELHREPYRKE